MLPAELIEIINKIIIVASSWLFVLLYQWCTVTQTSPLNTVYWNKFDFCQTARFGVEYIVNEHDLWPREITHSVYKNKLLKVEF